MERYTVFESVHWLVSQRRDSRYPGYLMVSSREQKAELFELSAGALRELGLVLRDAELLLRSVYSPFKVIFAKLGFSAGFASHFHAVPVTDSLLAEISSQQDSANIPDGNDTMLFLSRVYCERELTPYEQREMISTVSVLRQAANNSFQPSRGRTAHPLRMPE